MKGWAGVARLGGVGDNLIAASVTRPLKKLGYMVEVITSPTAQCVYQHNPFIDKLTIKYEGDIPGGEEWQKWFVNRAKEYDVFAHLSHSCEGRHGLQRGSTAFWWRPEVRRKLCAGSYLETVHDIAGVPYEFGPLFFPTDEEKVRAIKAKVEVTKGPYLGWVLAGSRIDKLYPYAAYVISRIIKELGIPVMMIGVGGAQFQMAKLIKQDVGRTNGVVGRNNIDVQGLHDVDDLHLAMGQEGSEPGGAGHWGLRRSLTQALAADLIVTPDTGIAWACAMEQMPKIMLHSHASVENITKHWVNTVSLHADPVRVPCWPCHRLHDNIDTCQPARDQGKAAACIADISVQSIIDAVAAKWPKRI